MLPWSSFTLRLYQKDIPYLEEILTACEDPLVQKQMAYMLARVGCRPEAEEDLARLMDGAHTTERWAKSSTLGGRSSSVP